MLKVLTNQRKTADTTNIKKHSKSIDDITNYYGNLM